MEGRAGRIHPTVLLPRCAACKNLVIPKRPLFASAEPAAMVGHILHSSRERLWRATTDQNYCTTISTSKRQHFYALRNRTPATVLVDTTPKRIIFRPERTTSVGGVSQLAAPRKRSRCRQFLASSPSLQQESCVHHTRQPPSNEIV